MKWGKEADERGSIASLAEPKLQGNQLAADHSV